MKLKFTIIAGLILSNLSYGQDVARGVVYEDNNKNGTRESDEKGIEQVAVSNGVDVVLTDTDGKYELPVRENSVYFVIKPYGYQYLLDEDNTPQFFYIHKPQGSPQLKYKGSKPSGKLPQSLDFALIKNQSEQKSFKALIFGDPQAYTMDQIGYFDKGIVKDIQNTEQFAFGLSLGDLVGNDLTLHQPYKKAIAQLGLPWYNVMGNHDLNFDVKEDEFSDETYEKNFGPGNFSFNYGDAHFIILDNILYPNPQTGKGYMGGLRKDQLDFVENNLKYVPKDKLIVLAFHIPLFHDNPEVFRTEDRQRLFDLLADYPNTVSMSAHTHLQRQNFYSQHDGWKQETPHHEYNVGTTSGDWYSGLKNQDGVPIATMRDGTPKGYAILNIDSNSYTFDYKVAGKPLEYQIQITFPTVVRQAYTRRHSLYANFFIGSAEDQVEYSLDGENWTEMIHAVQQDPSYQYNMLQFDHTETLLDGIRPSKAVSSTHLWEAKLPTKLEPGDYQIQIRATDMFGRMHTATKDIQIVP